MPTTKDPMSVTLKHLAAHTGLSLTTVCQVVKGNASLKYSDETRRRVLEAAEQLGYRPNESAQAMRTGRSNTFVLVLSTDHFRSYLPDELLRGVHDAAAAADTGISISIMPDEQLITDGFVPRFLKSHRADGLLLNYNQNLPPKALEIITRDRIPSVWINADLQQDAVLPDDVGGAASLTAQLIALGHRRITYVDFVHALPLASSHHSAATRFSGYESTMLAGGLRPDSSLSDCSAPYDQRVLLARHLLTKADRPTACVCYSAIEAGALYHACLQLGLLVPQHLSLACFDARADHDAEFPLSVMHLDEQQIGAQAVAMLHAKIADPKVIQPVRRVSMRFIDHGTCAPPPPDGV